MRTDNQLAFTSFLACFGLGVIAIAFLRLPSVEPGAETGEEPGTEAEVVPRIPSCSRA